MTDNIDWFKIGALIFEVEQKMISFGVPKEKASEICAKLMANLVTLKTVANDSTKKV